MADSQAKIAQKTWELSNNIMEVSFWLRQELKKYFNHKSEHNSKNRPRILCVVKIHLFHFNPFIYLYFEAECQ